MSSAGSPEVGIVSGIALKYHVPTAVMSGKTCQMSRSLFEDKDCHELSSHMILGASGDAALKRSSTPRPICG